jgi:hypothetical protein
MSTVQRKKTTSKKTRARRAEKPVSEGIKRAAERAGIEPSSTEAEPSEREKFEARQAQKSALDSRKLTLTLTEACNLVGKDLDPRDFRTEVFDVLARDLDVLSDIGESQFAAGFDGWCAFQNLRSRILLAGKIAAVIGGAS